MTRCMINQVKAHFNLTISLVSITTLKSLKCCFWPEISLRRCEFHCFCVQASKKIIFSSSVSSFPFSKHFSKEAPLCTVYCFERRKRQGWNWTRIFAFLGRLIKAYSNNLQTENTQNSSSTSNHTYRRQSVKFTFCGNPLTAIN